jgi:hypothetical protein
MLAMEMCGTDIRTPEVVMDLTEQINRFKEIMQQIMEFKIDMDFIILKHITELSIITKIHFGKPICKRHVGL